MNRGIYQNAILHDPTSDPAPTPLTPPQGWNRRLIAQHGSGCPSGWYIQGGRLGVNILDNPQLAEGYALFINTLNHPTNSCNAFLAAETTMMGKERFIETFGTPFYTVSTGGSGGAYTSLQVADLMPGTDRRRQHQIDLPGCAVDCARRPRRAAADALLHRHQSRRV